MRNLVLTVIAVLAAGLAGALPNPASENCVKNGGEVSIKKSPAGEYGVCVFEDNRQCEEWALMRGECPAGGKKITGYCTEPEIYCAISGGDPDKGRCVFPHAGECGLDEFYSGKCGRKETAAGDFMKELSGLWLALDYSRPAAKGELYKMRLPGDAAFSIYDENGTAVLWQTYNFHEACEFEIAGVKRSGARYDAALSTAPAQTRRAPDWPGGMSFIVLKYSAAGAQTIARHSGESDVAEWRVYARVAAQNADPDAALRDYVGYSAVGGKYKTAGGAKVEFLPEGKGVWGGKEFKYRVLNDYVLGPDCNMITLTGDIPVKGDMSFVKSYEGALELRALKESDKTGSGFECAGKVLQTLSPSSGK